jgi:hypothetical protein
MDPSSKAEIQAMRARVVARFEENTHSETAGAWDAIIEALLEEIFLVNGLPDRERGES